MDMFRGLPLTPLLLLPDALHDDIWIFKESYHSISSFSISPHYFFLTLSPISNSSCFTLFSIPWRGHLRALRHSHPMAAVPLTFRWPSKVPMVGTSIIYVDRCISYLPLLFQFAARCLYPVQCLINRRRLIVASDMEGVGPLTAYD